MHIAAAILPTAETMNPVEFATTAEALGFESIWFPEHSHIPTSRRSPWGGYEGAPPLPDYYARTYDPFVALGACAAATSTPDEAKLAALAEAGVTRAVVTMPQGPRGEVLAELERVAPLIEALRDA